MSSVPKMFWALFLIYFVIQMPQPSKTGPATETTTASKDVGKTNSNTEQPEGQETASCNQIQSFDQEQEGQTNSGTPGKSLTKGVGVLFDDFISSLKGIVKVFVYNTINRYGELRNMESLVNDFKSKYENETNQKIAENDLLALKKKLDAAYMNTVKLDVMADALIDKVNCVWSFYKQLASAILEDIEEPILENVLANQSEMEAAVQEPKQNLKQLLQKYQELKDIIEILGL